jgi:hypothetical protein
MHAWGAAIDISTAHADYWLSHRSGGAGAGYLNRIPVEIVGIFERDKWSHYDTMHFEYRPELFNDQPAAEWKPATSELRRTGVDAYRRP